jgi:ATP-binding cassette subfamily B protein
VDKDGGRVVDQAQAQSQLSDEADVKVDGEQPPGAPLTCHDLIATAQDAPRSLRKFPRLCRDAIGLVRASAPREFYLSIVLKVVNGLGLALLLLLGGNVVAGVLAADRSGAAFATILPKLAALTVVTVVLTLVSAAGRELREIIGALTGRYAQQRIIDVASTVELVSYETPSFHDRLLRATMGGQMRPMQLVEGLLGIIGTLLGVVAIAGTLLALQPWLLPLVLAAVVPLIIAAARAGEAFFGFQKRTTPAQRQRSYLFTLLTGKEPAKEVRAFGLAEYLRGRYDQLYEEHIGELRKTARKRLSFTIQGSLSMSTILAVTIGLLLFLALNHHLSLSQAGAAAAAVLILGERLMFTVLHAGQLYESTLFMEDYTSFLQLQPSPQERTEPAGVRRPSSLRLEDVTFTYPSATRPAVKGISMHIEDGEIVALVGENGSGKTTLAKLICRLYLPQAGRILWNGVDTADIEPDELRSSIAVIFQDFLHYSLSAGENIGIGRHQEIENLHRIEQAARQAGAHGFLAKLPNGYDTLLGPEFDGGIELSIGQWQRVALARAFFRDAPFIILDEPTAALDARAEAELFDGIRTLCQGRSVLLISHRFSSVRAADRIYVLHDGEVIEEGAHDALMTLGGLYADLFSLQAAAYLSPTVPTPEGTPAL